MGVDSQLSVLDLVVMRKGDAEIPGLTDTTQPRRLGPKRVGKIRKLFNLSKEDDVRQYVVHRIPVVEPRHCLDPAGRHIPRNRDGAPKRGRGEAQGSRKVEESSHRVAKGSGRVAVQNRRGGENPTRGLPGYSEVAAARRRLAKDGRELSLRRSLRACRPRNEQMRLSEVEMRRRRTD